MTRHALVLVAAVLLAACSSDPSPTAPSSPPSTTATTTVDLTTASCQELEGITARAQAANDRAAGQPAALEYLRRCVGAPPSSTP